MSAPGSVEMDLRIIEVTRSIEDEIAGVLLGKAAQVRIATAALISGQHLLLNDRPGVGKTTLGAAIAKVIDGAFGRIQGTPDLLPSDLTGSSIYNRSTDVWDFRPGPLLANVVLIDELNRITPRTQSALLQAMAEDQVTVEGVTRPLPNPFIVVATMNPAGSAGTFPLTTGQLDRFGATLGLGPVDREVERRLLRGEGGPGAIDRIEPVLPAQLLPELQKVVAAVRCADSVLDYILDLCDDVRSLGHLSARAAQSVLAMARGLAVLEGRNYVVPDDVKELAIPCLAHRLAAEGETIDRYDPAIRSRVEDLAVPDTSVR